MSKVLLVFAKRPTPGRVKTRLIPSLTPDEAAELYRRMLLDILAKAGQIADVDIVLCYEQGEGAREYFEGVLPGGAIRPQQGVDLGARMGEAFRHAFAAGYGRVAVIGTDSPDLPAEVICRAYGLLENPAVDAVFGPSEDGGYYLLALKRFHPELFAGISWSTGEVLERSLGRAGEAGIATVLLPVWYDVDTAADLCRSGLAAPDNGAPLTRELILRLRARGDRH